MKHSRHPCDDRAEGLPEPWVSLFAAAPQTSSPGICTLKCWWDFLECSTGYFEGNRVPGHKAWCPHREDSGVCPELVAPRKAPAPGSNPVPTGWGLKAEAPGMTAEVKSLGCQCQATWS